MRNGCCCLLNWLCDPRADPGSIESDYDGWPADWVYLEYLLRGISLSACFGDVTFNNNIGYIISNVYRYTL